MPTQPGHNAFQRNAFQRNAFQIVYNFAPSVTGGLVLGGSTTSRFKSAHRAVVDGGLVIGGSVTCEFNASGTHRAIVTGGIVLGGSVRTRYRPGVTPVVRRGGGGRVWNNIFRRPSKFRAKVTGGLILGGKTTADFNVQLPEVLPSFDIPGNAYFSRTSVGLRFGGSTHCYFTPGWPDPIIVLPEPEPEPDPIHYKARVSGLPPILSGGIKARFHSELPPPPVRKRRAPFFTKLKQQQLEEDELLLMGIL